MRRRTYIPLNKRKIDSCICPNKHMKHGWEKRGGEETVEQYGSGASFVFLLVGGAELTASSTVDCCRRNEDEKTDVHLF